MTAPFTVANLTEADMNRAGLELVRRKMSTGVATFQHGEIFVALFGGDGARLWKRDGENPRVTEWDAECSGDMPAQIFLDMVRAAISSSQRSRTSQGI